MFIFRRLIGAIILLPVILILLPGCKPRKRILKSPPHYNFAQPFTDKLDLKLKEISGIDWNTKADEFVCHNDESGKLYFLDKETKLIKREITFGGKGDYEDVALVHGIPYVLRSDGMITKVITDSSGKSYGQEAGKVPLPGLNDFETMYFDEHRKALIIICKNCSSDNKGSVSAFAFYPDSIGFDEKSVFTINAEQVKQMATVKTSKLQPSAAAIHPVLNKLFILSSASNQLVIADTDGNVESVYVLSKKLFPQPEGITFKRNGDMYISNEGIASKATLIKFLYIP